MFKSLGNLTKAVVSVAVAPVAAAVDVVTFIPDAAEERELFSRTGKILGNAGDCLSEAVKPDKE